MSLTPSHGHDVLLIDGAAVRGGRGRSGRSVVAVAAAALTALAARPARDVFEVEETAVGQHFVAVGVRLRERAAAGLARSTAESVVVMIGAEIVGRCVGTAVAMVSFIHNDRPGQRVEPSVEIVFRFISLISVAARRVVRLLDLALSSLVSNPPADGQTEQQQEQQNDASDRAGDVDSQSGLRIVHLKRSAEEAAELG